MSLVATSRLIVFHIILKLAIENMNLARVQMTSSEMGGIETHEPTRLFYPAGPETLPCISPRMIVSGTGAQRRPLGDHLLSWGSSCCRGRTVGSQPGIWLLPHQAPKSEVTPWRPNVMWNSPKWFDFSKSHAEIWNHNLFKHGIEYMFPPPDRKWLLLVGKPSSIQWMESLLK